MSRTNFVKASAIAAALALTLAGCAGKDSGSNSATKDGSGGWSAGTDTIQVGLIGPMTGPFAVLGISQLNGLQVAADSINADGGIGGAKIKIVSRDMQLDPGKGVQFANELAGDSRVKMVVGPSISSFYAAAQGTFEQNKMLNCQPGVAGGSFADLKYGFRMENSAEQDMIRNLEYLKEQGIKSVGLVYEGDDTGKGYEKLLTKMAPKYGVKMEGFQQTRVDDTSHNAYVEKLADAGALFISNSASGAKTMAAAQATGYKGQMLGGSGAQNISFLESAGDAADGMVFDAPMYQFPLRDKANWSPGYKSFVKAIQSKYGENVGPKSGAKSPKGAAIASDCVIALAKAAENAKSVDKDKLADAMAKLDISAQDSASGCPIKPDEAHESYPLECIRLYKWQKDADGWFTTDVTPK